ncbi:MAG: acyltransferase family protein [Halothiobacillus sp.]
MQPEAQHKHYYPNLDLLRAFAAISVMMYHIIYTLPWPVIPLENPLIRWFTVGWMGVDLFFVISGFVIGLAALQAYRNNPAEFYPTFARHRFARITPLYYLTGAVVLIGISPALWQQPDIFLKIFTYFSFTQNLSIHTAQIINAPSYTIGIEVQFYLLIALLIPWLSRLNPLAILFTGVGIAWLWRTLGWYWFSGSNPDIPAFVLYMLQVPGMLDQFALGFVLARWATDGIGWHSHRLDGANLLARIRKYHGLVLGLFVLAAALTWHLIASYASDYWHQPNMVVFWRSLVGLTAALLVLWMIVVQFPRWLDILLTPIRYLGRISFGIYLWHYPLIILLKAHGYSEPWRFSILVITGAIALATLSYHLFERPLQRRWR